MTPLAITKTNYAAITKMRTDYLAGTSAPLDGMWLAFAAMADAYLMERRGKPLGYALVNGADRLLQFHTLPDTDACALFREFLEIKTIKGAFVSTAEPRYQALAMDHQHTCELNAVMYHRAENAAAVPATFPKGSIFRLLEAYELEAAVAFARMTLGADEGWLTTYYTDLIKGKELFALMEGEAIIAIGERRISDMQQGVADIGMVVGTAHRNKGIAANILRALVARCETQGLTAICSTERDNIAAHKAIERAGFTSYHHILELGF